MKKASIGWFLLTMICLVLPNASGQWKPHEVRQLNGRAGEIKLPAKLQLVTESWKKLVYVPYLVYMPDKDRLLLLANCDKQAIVITTDDRGVTWSQPKYVHVDAAGKPDAYLGVSLTYLGGGKVVLAAANDSKAWYIPNYLWFSNDYGERWGNPTRVPQARRGEEMNLWDPYFVDRDPSTGKVVRLVETGYMRGDESAWEEGGYSQGLIRTVTDEVRTWSEGVVVPEWRDFNEINVVRAKNGDLVAALRSDGPKRFGERSFDHYSGLGVSISKDNGKTWSKVNMLYEWGRHHPSLVVLPNGDIVMSYVVRLGYADTADGYSQWGIEAVVSHDHGQTWDLDHRYILSNWKGKIKGPGAWVSGSQATSTVLLPDGSLVTAYGTGQRALIDVSPRWRTAMDVGLVRWNVNQGPVNSEHTIADAPFNSDLRNKFDPDASFSGKPLARTDGNIAVKELGAKVSSSTSDEDPNQILDDRYPYVQPVVSLQTIPGWVEIAWPKAHRIDEIRIHPGPPCLPIPWHGLASQSTPAEYRLQYQKGGKWVDLVPPVTHAISHADFRKEAGKWNAEFEYVHKFAPVRVYITRSGDPGTRGKKGEERAVPEDKRETSLRLIEVFAAK